MSSSRERMSLRILASDCAKLVVLYACGAVEDNPVERRYGTQICGELLARIMTSHDALHRMQTRAAEAAGVVDEQARIGAGTIAEETDGR